MQTGETVPSFSSNGASSKNSTRGQLEHAQRVQRGGKQRAHYSVLPAQLDVINESTVMFACL